MSKGIEKIEGVVTPAVTPLAKGKVDDRAVAGLLSFLKKSGVSGVFPAGSTGAFPFLSVDKHIAVIKAFYEHMPGKMLFLPGSGRNSISETVEVSRVALKLDADAVVVVTPYYIRLDQKALADYFSKVAAAVKGPMVLYNIPQLTGNSIGAHAVKALVSKHRNIMGIKDSSSDFESFSKIVDAVSDRISVLQGEDNLLLPSLMLGASGGVCGTTNFSDAAVKVYKAFKSKKGRTSEKLQETLSKIMSSASALPFPSNYNYLFYRAVMGKRETNAPEPLPKISPAEGDRVFREIGRLGG